MSSPNIDFDWFIVAYFGKKGKKKRPAICRAGRYFLKQEEDENDGANGNRKEGEEAVDEAAMAWE